MDLEARKLEATLALERRRTELDLAGPVDDAPARYARVQVELAELTLRTWEARAAVAASADLAARAVACAEAVAHMETASALAAQLHSLVAAELAHARSALSLAVGPGDAG